MQLLSLDRRYNYNDFLQVTVDTKLVHQYNTGMANKLRIFRDTDPDWKFSTDGIVVMPRAGFEITKDCPAEYRQIIMMSIDFGWLKPVGYMKQSEYLMEVLSR